MKPMKEMESAAQKKLESWTRIEACTGLQWIRRRSLVQVFPWFTYIKLKCPNRLRIGGVTDLHTHTCHTCNVYVVNKNLIILGQWVTSNLGLKC